ncbi:MAG: long-chain fatty acid--CoA ligase [Proteobacteria bacterium]|nr:long-chain fatty acid--CoA ligase [Pseudomonadota bacterium]
MEVRTYPEYSTNYPLLLTVLMKRPVSLYPEETGVVYRNPETGLYQRFTWKEWYDRTCRLANVLNALGLKPGRPGEPGDRVSTIALSHHYHLELYFAVSCMGAVLHPINMRLSLDHMIHTIIHSEDKVLFFDDQFLPMVESIYDQIKGVVEKFVYISDEPGLPKTSIENLHSYRDLLEQHSPEFEWPYLHEDTPATLCYTTGTTGLPKGVVFTHRALYLQTVHQVVRSSFNSDPTVVDLGEDDTVLVNVPLYHIHGWGIPYRCVFAGNKVVLPGTFTVDGFCELVQTEKITSSNLVPTMLSMIIEYQDLDKHDLSSLRNILVGGGALPLGLKMKAEKKIPGFTATSGYGMTETAPSAVGAYVKKNLADQPPEEIDKIRVKTGLPYPGLEVAVVDEKGNPVPPDDETIGQIALRGPWVMKEYYKDPEKTAEVWHDGWFHTGDVAKIDKEGYLTIVDRVSDMIRSGAEMVPTVLLENLAATADFVQEATFVGVPDEKWGQRPMAIIKLVAGSDKTEKDVMEFLDKEGVDKGKITRWMLPDYVMIIDDIPKTSVGKFDKKSIRSRMDDFLSKAEKTK